MVRKVENLIIETIQVVCDPKNSVPCRVVLDEFCSHQMPLCFVIETEAGVNR